MKCIRCGTNNNYQDRQDKKCKKCGHKFVFEPKTMTPKITDALFAKILNDISFKNTIFYSQKQFDYYFDKIAKNRKSKSVIAVLIFIFFVSNICFTGFVGVIFGWLLATVTLLGMTSIYFGVVALLNKKPKVQEFIVKQSQLREWQDKWNSINSTPEKLLPSITSNPNLISNSELNHYSFDRLVVCQKDEIAHFLIANNFHLENNCAILSITGYPENTFQTILNMARQNPNLKVYGLHDCSASGMNLVYNLQTQPNWFLNYQVQIYDLWLSYEQVMKMPNTFVRKDSNSQKIELPLEVPQNLSSEEIKWLEKGYYIELESFSPKFLLKVVKKGITNGDDDFG